MKVIFAPLLVPVIGGDELITRIRYPVPIGCPGGINPAMVVEFADVATVPMLIGEAKLPLAFDNCAVKIFAELYGYTEGLKVTVTEVLKFPSTQYVNGEIAFVLMVFKIGQTNDASVELITNGVVPPVGLTVFTDPVGHVPFADVAAFGFP